MAQQDPTQIFRKKIFSSFHSLEKSEETQDIYNISFEFYLQLLQIIIFKVYSSVYFTVVFNCRPSSWKMTINYEGQYDE